MPFTPSTLRAPLRPRQSFSHEQLLQICYFYKNLLNATRGVQGQINEALDEFRHSQYGTMSTSVTKLLSALSAIDASVRGPLLDEIMQVELAVIRWETKSSKLKSEARRQRRIRARKSFVGEAAEAPNETLADFGFDDDEVVEEPFVGEAPSEVFADEVLPNDDFFTKSPVVISPTMALAQRGMSQLPQTLNGRPGETPTNEGYKKSGLV